MPLEALEAHRRAVGHPRQPGSPGPFSQIPTLPRLDQTALPANLGTLGSIRGRRGFRPVGSRVRGSLMMKKILVAAAVALAPSSVSFAQQAVQWKVGDGGNGHWYQRVEYGMTWNQAQATAESMGGHLATITSPAENSFVHSIGFFACWLGGYQVPGACEPDCGWRWITGEPMVFLNWTAGEPNNAVGTENRLHFFEWTSLWNDHQEYSVFQSIFEWSADCNGDGIVDYGQCRDGTLPDYNGNNIPDCCESGTSCVSGNYPVQWRVPDGGNGHWYQTIVVPDGVNASQARSIADAYGGKLLEGCGAEIDWVFERTAASRLESWRSVSSYQHHGPYIGLSKVGGVFTWPGGEACAFDRWDCCDEPTNSSAETAVMFFRFGVPPNSRCHDVAPIAVSNGAVLEWSADCNNDGIVDKGQILQGLLSDIDQDGIPDTCQAVTCVDADFFRDFNVNGADLGILLSQWGPNTPLTVCDLTRDGAVNGDDLGIFLSYWGPCP
jgi:hypothetical protein